MADFLNTLLKELGDEYTSLASDGEGSAEFSGTLDTGSYMLNALVSGSLYGGVPNNKITAFAGEQATGKTFFVLSIVKSFLDTNPEGYVVYYDTEAAVTKDMMESRGISTNRVLISEPETIQKLRTHAIKVLDKYAEQPAPRPPMLMVLDSLGMLSTSKEMEDSTEGKETRDMTKSQTIKAAFRVLTLKLAKVGVPMLVTNHVYAVVGAYVPMQELGGGSGLKYAASTIVTLSKKKDKDGTDVVGALIKAKTYKSRLSKENSDVTLRLNFKSGLDRYYGLLDLAEKYEVIKKVSTRYELPDGTKVFGKEINTNPEKYFTPEVMEKLEQVARQEFMYGDHTNDPAVASESSAG